MTTLIIHDLRYNELSSELLSEYDEVISDGWLLLIGKSPEILDQYKRVTQYFKYKYELINCYRTFPLEVDNQLHRVSFQNIYIFYKGKPSPPNKQKIKVLKSTYDGAYYSIKSLTALLREKQMLKGPRLYKRNTVNKKENAMADNVKKMLTNPMLTYHIFHDYCEYRSIICLAPKSIKDEIRLCKHRNLHIRFYRLMIKIFTNKNDKIITNTFQNKIIQIVSNKLNRKYYDNQISN